MAISEIIERLQFIADNATTVIPEEVEQICDIAAECLRFIADYEAITAKDK